MSKNAKKWLVVAAFFVAIGAILFVTVMTVYRWDFSRLSTVRFETNTYEIGEEFRDINISTETADIVFAASGDGVCRVVCLEKEKTNHSVSVQNGTLTVKFADNRKWYEHIGVGFRSPKVTVYLPKNEYGSLVIKESTGDITLPKDFIFADADLTLSTGAVDGFASASGRMRIKTGTGDIHLQGISAGELDLTVSTGLVDAKSVSCEGEMGVSVTTGETELTDISCKRFRSAGSTGDITMKNVIAAEMLFIERSTGDVRLDGCDAGELEISTDTGSVTGDLLSEKVFVAHSDTGNVRVPETTGGGKCKITTDTGDIRIGIRK